MPFDIWLVVEAKIESPEIRGADTVLTRLGGGPSPRAPKPSGGASGGSGSQLNSLAARPGAPS